MAQGNADVTEYDPPQGNPGCLSSLSLLYSKIKSAALAQTSRERRDPASACKKSPYSILSEEEELEELGRHAADSLHKVQQPCRAIFVSLMFPHRPPTQSPTKDSSMPSLQANTQHSHQNTTPELSQEMRVDASNVPPTPCVQAAVLVLNSLQFEGAKTCMPVVSRDPPPCTLGYRDSDRLILQPTHIPSACHIHRSPERQSRWCSRNDVHGSAYCADPCKEAVRFSEDDQQRVHAKKCAAIIVQTTP